MQSSSKFRFFWAAVVAAGLWGGAPAAAGAGHFSVLYSFTGGADGGTPGPVTLDPGGGLYGVAEQGGLICRFNFGRGCGVIYGVSAAGQFSVLATLDGSTMGAFPDGTLTLSGGTLYGSAFEGGARATVSGGGTIFTLAPTGGGFTVLHSFGAVINGTSPDGPLVVDAKHDVFGVAYSGGAYNGGVLFVVTPGGGYAKLHDFNPATEGYRPQGVSSDAEGNLYGALYGAAPNNCAMIYKYSLASGVFSTVSTFCGSVVPPQIGSIDSAGTLYLGFSAENNLFALRPDGSGYVYTPIYQFSYFGGGFDPNGPVETAGPALIGTTVADSQSDSYTGTLFTYGKTGLTTLHMFSGGADGDSPSAPSVAGTGVIYGATEFGGTPSCAIVGYQQFGCGVVYGYTP